MYNDFADAVESFKEKGFTYTYHLDDNSISCKELEKEFSPLDLTIVESYTHDSGTDPGSESTVYAIESKKGDKGLLIIAYGMYADPSKAKLIDRLLGK
jgi:hypothetical protein